MNDPVERGIVVGMMSLSWREWMGPGVQWMVSCTTWMGHLMHTFSTGVNTGSYSFYVQTSDIVQKQICRVSIGLIFHGGAYLGKNISKKTSLRSVVMKRRVEKYQSIIIEKKAGRMYRQQVFGCCGREGGSSLLITSISLVKQEQEESNVRR